MNTEETMAAIEISVGRVIGKRRKPEPLSALHAATIAYAKYNRRDHH